jgi:AAA domain, putative AbiEii toxin, Type IV TA system
MMKISSVHIENFKSFASTGEISLGQVNVLVGRNNHGKSAFIRAIHLMQQGPELTVNDIRIGAQQAVIEITLESEDLLPELQHYYGKTADKYYKNESKNGSLRAEITLFRQSNGTFSFEFGFPNWSPALIRAIEPDNFIYTYLSKRKVMAFDRAVDVDRARAVVSDMRYLVAKVARLANPDYERYEEYTKLCNAVLGFRITAYPAPGGQQAGIPIGAHGHIPIESMGEGVSSQLGLITDLCMADGNLLLIEEPENDIHPEGLKTLLNVIAEKSERNQFIVSTHSNIVTRYLGAIPDSKVFEFESEYKRNEVPTSAILEVEPTAEARIEVLRRLGYELSDFDLWDGWLILEESSAEVIIRYLVPWFAPSLSRVRTVAAGGTSKVRPTFDDFHRLFLFSHLEPQYRGRAWVVVDGDNEGQKVITGLKTAYKDWPPDHFTTWSQPDFEHYYPSQFARQVKDVLAKPHDEKPAAKKRLLDEIKAWCEANQKDAKAAFAASAAEVIKKLKEIDQSLRVRQ